MLLCDGVPNIGEFITVKFNQLVAHLAIKMIVLWITIVMLVDGSTAERHFPKQPCVNQLGERSIDRRSADCTSFRLAGEAGDKFVGVEMVVPLENVLDQDPTLLRDSLAPALQVFVETLSRRERDLHLAEREIIGHGGTVV
jgi:hypothetical protein